MAIHNEIVVSVIDDLTQPNQWYHVAYPVSAAGHFGWTMAVFASSTANYYVDVFHPPTHDQYPDPTKISYGNLYDLQMRL